MNEDILAIGGFFFTVIVLTLGVPLVRSWTRRREQEPPKSIVAMDERLARIETAIESMAIEVERISEGQRFVTRLLAEREQQQKSLPVDRS
jgi:uncharacterized membrane protein